VLYFIVQKVPEDAFHASCSSNVFYRASLFKWTNPRWTVHNGDRSIEHYSYNIYPALLMRGEYCKKTLLLFGETTEGRRGLVTKSFCGLVGVIEKFNSEKELSEVNTEQKNDLNMSENRNVRLYKKEDSRDSFLSCPHFLSISSSLHSILSFFRLTFKAISQLNRFTFSDSFTYLPITWLSLNNPSNKLTSRFVPESSLLLLYRFPYRLEFKSNNSPCHKTREVIHVQYTFNPRCLFTNSRLT